MRFIRSTRLRLSIVTMASLLVLGAGPFLMRSNAATLQDRSLKLSDSNISTLSNYEFSFGLVTSGSVGSIRFQFCSDTPLVDYPCTAPIGFDASGASLSAQTGESGFTIDASSDVNNLILTRVAVAAAAGPVSYTFNSVQNPDTVGSYYVRVMTYPSTDASGPHTDEGGLAYAINSPVDISTYVPPYLLYCSGLTITAYDCNTASGDYLNFGELSANTTKSGSMEMVLATNVDTGYNVFLNGTTMTSNNSVITGIAPSDVSRPGTNQFGINLAANSTPTVGASVHGPGLGSPTANYGTPNLYRFVSGEKIATANQESDFSKYTISYIANIKNGQAPGIYVTTLQYIAVGSF